MLNGAGPEGELQTSRGYSTLLDGSRFTLAHDLAFSAKLAGFANNAPRRKFLFTARGCHRETSSDAPRGIRLKTADSARLLGITYEGRGESWGVNKPRCARLITSLASAPGSWPARIDAYLREIPLERCVRDEYARVCLRRGRGGERGKANPGINAEIYIIHRPEVHSLPRPPGLFVRVATFSSTGLPVHRAVPSSTSAKLISLGARARVLTR